MIYNIEGITFTSHIVQIKPRQNNPQTAQEFSLYIPHSSDKTKIETNNWSWDLQTLYIPHSSDKTTISLVVCPFLRTFTSHIVQIKQATGSDVKQQSLLYIPHSSDKTQHLPPKSNIDNTPILEFCQVVQVK